eukprot:TRINITY_DN2755_c0_g1_i1.p1 TRINITY_DN2755_c0_g1~~TRINITY_DN2755_c0_g1_i1.p1  ORF type:complete len:110 (+),score=26.40 TRINITY_DN2755_c0_g1_i1:247-576(+)
MFDIERVELLRGPQGVLFGRNSTGGTLNIVSKAPSDELEGTVGVTIGNYNKRTFSGTMSGPLSDNVRGRLTLLKNCLLYTSDAADDLLCVDLGGRRIIKKKKKCNSVYI